MITNHKYLIFLLVDVLDWGADISIGLFFSMTHNFILLAWSFWQNWTLGRTTMLTHAKNPNEKKVQSK